MGGKTGATSFDCHWKWEGTGQQVLTVTRKWEGWVGAGNFTFYTAPRGLLLSKDIEGIFILHGA